MVPRLVRVRSRLAAWVPAWSTPPFARLQLPALAPVAGLDQEYLHTISWDLGALALFLEQDRHIFPGTWPSGMTDLAFNLSCWSALGQVQEADTTFERALQNCSTTSGWPRMVGHMSKARMTRRACGSLPEEQAGWHLSGAGEG